MKRREFITLLAARQRHGRSRRGRSSRRCRWSDFLTANRPTFRVPCLAFRQGLSESGYVEGRTSRSSIDGPTASTIDFRALVADLVRREVTVIARE